MSTLRTNTIVDAAGGFTTTINGIYLRPGVIESNNRIINGAFDFWQRGTSFTTNVYGADRWINAITGGTVTMSRQAFTAGDTLGSNNSTFFLRQLISGQTLSSQYAAVQQAMERVRSYAGQTFTILGWARRSSGSGNMTVAVNQYFGTGGSPSSPVNGIGATTVPLTASWAPFAVTISVPSITGKIIGTNGDDSLRLTIWTSAGSDFNSLTNTLGLQTIGVDFWGIHTKLGTHTVDAVNLYNQPELGPELAQCMRYYEILPPQPTSTYGVIGTYYAASDYRAFWPFKVVKRATPTLATSTWAPISPTLIFPHTHQVQYYATGPFYSTSTLAADSEL